MLVVTEVNCISALVLVSQGDCCTSCTNSRYCKVQRLIEEHTDRVEREHHCAHHHGDIPRNTIQATAGCFEHALHPQASAQACRATASHMPLIGSTKCGTVGHGSEYIIINVSTMDVSCVTEDDSEAEEQEGVSRPSTLHGRGLASMLVVISKVREEFPHWTLTFSVTPSPMVSDTVVEPCPFTSSLRTPTRSRPW